MPDLTEEGRDDLKSPPFYYEYGIIQIKFQTGNRFSIFLGDIGLSGTYRLAEHANRRSIEFEYYGHRTRYDYVIDGDILMLVDAAGKARSYEWREVLVCEGSSMC